MNRTILFAALFMGIVTFLAGCTKEEFLDPDGDVPTVYILLKMVDSAGNNLLDENTPGTIVNNKLMAQCDDRTFEFDSSRLSYVNERWNGMHLATMYPDTSQYLLYIGYWEGEYNYQNREIIMDWGDGTKDIIAFDHIYQEGSKWTLDVRLNGKNVQSFVREMKNEIQPIIIVK